MTPAVARGLVAALVTACALRIAAQGVLCNGDCDGDADVTADEIVRMAAAALGGNASACSAGDADGNGDITVDEIMTAVTHALHGCVPKLSGSAAIRLFPGFKLGVGRQPVSLSLADMDGDGRVDVSTANGGSNDLSLRLRTASGGFAGDARIAAGCGPRFVLAAAIAGGGHRAILAANSESDELSVTVVSQAGVVTERYRVGDSPVALAAADLDGDSLNDVIVANRGSADVSILSGTPDGSFLPARSFSAGGSPRSVASGDINGDLMADVVVALGARHLVALHGLGNGELRPANTIDAGMPVSVVVIDDLNLDHANDLVVLGGTSDNASNVGVLLGNGDGSFQAAEYVAATSSQAIAVTDIDADMVPDLVSADDASVSVFFDLGVAEFEQELSLPSGCSVSAVAVADLDGDEMNDIVFACGFDDEVGVFWGLGRRRFAAERILPAGGLLPERILVADVNADAVPDLATVNGLSNDISILQADGEGGFAPPVVVATQDGLLGAALGDLNGDAAADLVTSHESAACRDCLIVFSRQAGGAFERRRQLALAPRVVDLAIADLDENALGDIIALGTEQVSVFVGLGGFEFAPETKTFVGSEARAMSVADLDADGRSDIATVNGGSMDVTVLFAAHDGGFAPALSLPLTVEPASIAAVDANADGHVDLFIQGGGRFSIFFGHGGGVFSAEQRIGNLVAGGRFALADIDGDGFADLVAISGGSAVHLGTGTFLSLRFAGNPLAADVALVDVNGDGALDIATANATLPGSVSVMLGSRP
jgi:hypothetical protein